MSEYPELVTSSLSTTSPDWRKAECTVIMLVGSKYILPRHDDAAQQSNTEIGRYFDVHFQYKMMLELTY